MPLLKKLIYSLGAILLIGIVYFFLLRHVYYNQTTKSFTESSLNENFLDVLKGLVNIDFNGKSVSIFSLTLITLLHFIVSFIIAVILGITIGVIVGTNKTIGKASDYFINFFRVLPSIVFIIVFKYQLKFFENHVYFVGVIACIWPVIINTKSGVEKVNKTLRESISTLNIPRLKKLILFTLPEASPNIWDGIKTSLGIAFLISITCEYLSKSLFGLGAILSFYDENPGSVCQSMIIILWIGLLGVMTNFLFDYLESRISWLKNQFSTDDE
jgi:bicarbonate transport system permease protein